MRSLTSEYFPGFRAGRCLLLGEPVAVVAVMETDVHPVQARVEPASPAPLC